MIQPIIGDDYLLSIYQAPSTHQLIEFPPQSWRVAIIRPILQMRGLRRGKRNKLLAQTYRDRAGSACTPPSVTHLGDCGVKFRVVMTRANLSESCIRYYPNIHTETFSWNVIGTAGVLFWKFVSPRSGRH